MSTLHKVKCLFAVPHRLPALTSPCSSSSSTARRLSSAGRPPTPCTALDTWRTRWRTRRIPPEPRTPTSCTPWYAQRHSALISRSSPLFAHTICLKFISLHKRPAPGMDLFRSAAWTAVLINPSGSVSDVVYFAAGEKIAACTPVCLFSTERTESHGDCSAAGTAGCPVTERLAV